MLHRTDYRHCVRDLKQYVDEGCFPGRIQANPHVVPPIYQDPYVAGAGTMTGPHVDHTNNRASNSRTSYSQPSIHPSGEAPLPSLDERFNSLTFSGNNSITESSGYDPLAVMQMNIPSSTYPMNDNMRYMLCETSMLAGQHYQMSTHNYNYNNSTENINNYANPPIQDAMLHFDQTDGYGELPGPFHRGKNI